jgi:hypothetical protein
VSDLLDIPLVTELIESRWQREAHMKKRISVWALVGFAVACGWVLFGVVTGYNLGHWAITSLTAPPSLLGRHWPLAFYWFILLNAGFYAVLGTAAELVRLLLDGRIAGELGL